MSENDATGSIVSSRHHSKTFFTQPDNQKIAAIKRRMEARSESVSRQASTRNSATASALNTSRNNNNGYVYRTPVNFYHSSVSNFGKDGIHYTIGSSRKDKKYNQSTPGPGSYDPPISGQPQDNLKYKIRFRLAQNETTNGSSNLFSTGEVPPSLNVNFINKRSFPEIKNKTIGISRNDTNTWFIKNNSPGPSFLPKTTLSNQSHRITSRTPIDKTYMNNPGPGNYNPEIGIDSKFSTSPSYSCQGPSRRDEWIIKSIDYNVTDDRTNERIKNRSKLQRTRIEMYKTDPNNEKNKLKNIYEPEGFGINKFYNRTGGKDNLTIPNCTGPGPSDYSPYHKVVNKKEPEWTIGNKSRKSKKRKNPNPPKSRFVGISMFVIPLGLETDIETEKKYIDEHPDIRMMIEDVMEIILSNKPNEPLLLMKDYFEQMKTDLKNKRRAKSELRSYPKLGSARRF